MQLGNVGGTPALWVGAIDDTADARDPLPLALFPQGCVCRDLALHALAAAGRRWNVVVTSSTNVAGMAVTVMDTCLIGPGLRRLGPEDDGIRYNSSRPHASTASLPIKTTLNGRNAQALT